MAFAKCVRLIGQSSLPAVRVSMSTSTTSAGGSWAPRTSKRVSTLAALDRAHQPGDLEQRADPHRDQRGREQQQRAGAGRLHAAPTSSATKNSESTWKDWSTDAASPKFIPSARLTRTR